MRIIAGDWRGRALRAPSGIATRPTADRVRQALFDMLIHARWAGPDLVEDAIVLDAFAGSGALGLEALSRGAAQATFMENDRASLAALRANIAACGAQDRCRVLEVDVLTAPLGAPSGLVFLDPPYGEALVPQAMARLRASGWIAPGALVVAETGRGDTPAALGELLAERVHGPARVSIWRETK
jgi:16S rRNA (guanine966-N2)-methyltransferase